MGYFTVYNMELGGGYRSAICGTYFEDHQVLSRETTMKEKGRAPAGCYSTWLEEHELEENGQGRICVVKGGRDKKPNLGGVTTCHEPLPCQEATMS